ncbi:NUDIX domain-containing protein [Caballeronia sp. LZ035]|uniref:NUDIX domain-containing protein n=1 Tax=Caballeronia sp. LZ035 TaxID=3038568 RepID=UPI0028659BCF|nr:NUDIX domain-containing protein [Caballeronia sp. LZ035]MDR5759825.1 NUDIX domain-containing protein [Caballeronia sp. LZ035]
MRTRATVLLVRHHTVLLVRERGGPWLLPGGTIGHDELAIVAAIRALFDDTGVEASAAALLFQQVSAHHLHHVFRVAIPDDVHPQPAMGGRVDEVVWLEPSQLAHVSTTPGTRAILNRALALGSDVRVTRSAWSRDESSSETSKRWR